MAEPIDISVTIRPRMPIYEGNPGVSIDLALSQERGDPANVSRLEMGAHTGTHVDAPRHFFTDGPGIDALALDTFVGPCVVADATAADCIDRRVVDSLRLAPGTERVLFKTTNSRLWERDTFTPDFVKVDGSGAQALIELGVRLVGIDYLSVGGPDAHTPLLGSGVAVVEAIDLREVDPGDYLLSCLPIKIAGCDGGAARAVLWPL